MMPQRSGGRREGRGSIAAERREDGIEVEAKEEPRREDEVGREQSA
jgi:hypothetical protein